MTHKEFHPGLVISLSTRLPEYPNTTSCWDRLGRVNECEEGGDGLGCEELGDEDIPELLSDVDLTLESETKIF